MFAVLEQKILEFWFPTGFGQICKTFNITATDTKTERYKLHNQLYTHVWVCVRM